jgi:hypothetical protein
MGRLNLTSGLSRTLSFCSFPSVPIVALESLVSKPARISALSSRLKMKGGESKGKADAEGAYNAALFPFAKGKRSGKVRFAVTGKSCKIGIELPWSEGSYQYQ